MYLILRPLMPPLAFCVVERHADRVGVVYPPHRGHARQVGVGADDDLAVRHATRRLGRSRHAGRGKKGGTQQQALERAPAQEKTRCRHHESLPVAAGTMPGRRIAWIGAGNGPRGRGTGASGKGDQASGRVTGAGSQHRVTRLAHGRAAIPPIIRQPGAGAATSSAQHCGPHATVIKQIPGRPCGAAARLMTVHPAIS